MNERGADKLARITAGDGFATITFERFYPHPPETVWRALTEPEALASWYLTEARIEGGEGGTVDFHWNNSRLHVTGKITEWEPPSAFEHEWNIPPSNELPGGEYTVVRWELAGKDNGTVLKLTHRNLSVETASGHNSRLDPVAAMHVFLDRLAAQLDSVPMPDWLQSLKEAKLTYRGSANGF